VKRRIVVNVESVLIGCGSVTCSDEREARDNGDGKQKSAEVSFHLDLLYGHSAADDDYFR
jgi:hypothetical protein